MRLSLYQYDIVWEDPEANLLKIKETAQSLVGCTDLLILPEMATTGFSMSPELHAVTMQSEQISQLQALANETHIALAGSFMIQEGDLYFNRAILFKPNEECQFNDKKHLFRMGSEAVHYRPSSTPPSIIHYNGWNIRLLICYDLRFPVWSRNKNNEYDLLIYTANWPKARTHVWNTLLPARAIENIAYICGVNRTGTDGNKLEYEGSSQLIDFKGNSILNNGVTESVKTISLDLQALNNFRVTFPAWKDADRFHLYE